MNLTSVQRLLVARRPNPHGQHQNHQAGRYDKHGVCVRDMLTRSRTALIPLALLFEPLPCGTQNEAASVMRCDSCCLRFCQPRRLSCSCATWSELACIRDKYWLVKRSSSACNLLFSSALPASKILTTSCRSSSYSSSARLRVTASCSRSPISASAASSAIISAFRLASGVMSARCLLFTMSAILRMVYLLPAALMPALE